MPQQIPIDFARPSATFSNYVTGRNAELAMRLASLDFPTVLYLWGAPGSGKTHLVEATRCAHGPRVVTADDAHAIDAAAQEALFDAFNLAMQGGPKLVVAGDRPPLRLAMREDLRTRLGAGLVFETHGLDDDEKRIAIIAAARERGLTITDEFAQHLLTRFRRDMRHLVGLIDALDRHSLATQRPVTLALLRELVQDLPALAR